MPGRATDPLVGFHFGIEVSGKVSGLFTEVGGLGSESDIVEHKATTPAGVDFVQKMPGRLKWGDITLKRGITATMDVWAWRQLVIDGKTVSARANGSVSMYDTDGTLVAQWDFVNGWPSKVSGPSLTSDSTAFGVEEMTIVHEGIKRIK
ncbi:MAG: phage tail protein [Anaerolineae bacterium]|nr:phage tail protein [Anaerolineae bacterium]